LKFFPSGNKNVEKYEGGRSLKNFVDFINEKTGTRRNEDGSLALSAGRYPKLDFIANRIYKGNKQQIEELKQLCKNEFTEKDCQYYIKFAESLSEKGGDFIEKERTRLQGLLKSSSVTKTQKDSFRLRYNILSGFVEGPEIATDIETDDTAGKEEI